MIETDRSVSEIAAKLAIHKGTWVHPPGFRLSDIKSESQYFRLRIEVWDRVSYVLE